MSGTTQIPADSYDDVDQTLSEALAQEEVTSPVLTPWRAFLQRFLASRNLAITVVAILLFVFFSLTANNFLTPDNVFTILRNVSLIGIVSVGMTYLLIAGEIDLSVGSLYGCLIVILGILVVKYNVDPWLGSLVVIVLGTLVGMLTGLLRTRIGIPSFIITLAMLTAFRSLALVISQRNPSVTDGTSFFYDVTGGYIAGNLPWFVVWMAVVMIAGGVLLSRTKLGYHIYAIGGNLEAARNSGIDTNRVKLICFMITGGLCGLISALLFGYLHVAAPTTGTGFEFRVIGAVIVGGAALTGGRGAVYGSFVGALIIGMMTSGLVLLGLSEYYGDVATGLLIVLIGCLDIYVRHVASQSMSYVQE